MPQAMLTTIDNPFNPFTEWDDWYRFDRDHRYHTTEYLARIAKTSDALSDEENDIAIDDAIDEIVELNVIGVYKKVFN